MSLKYDKNNLISRLPEGYEAITGYEDGQEMLKEMLIEDNIAYQKETDMAECSIIIFPAEPGFEMPHSRREEIIEFVGDTMTENQKLIEVETGVAATGEEYTYFIVKTPHASGFGADFFLRLHLFYEDRVIELNGEFMETGIEGLRYSMGNDFSDAIDLSELAELGIEGIDEALNNLDDKKGISMDMSDKPEFDAKFPNHPLSQIRELLRALLGNDYK